METPLQLDFQGMEPNETVRSSVTRHLAMLEERFGRVTACRVAIRGPGEHHRTGGLYEVGIRLVLPNGKEVNIGRTPPADERHGDLIFALNDAFKRARRRLQDQARRMQGQVKARVGPPIGTITRFDSDGGFGFLETADGREIYFHRNSVLDADPDHLSAGMRVTFAEEMGEKGPQASTVKLLGRHGMR
jgi:cold shock CspA family protein